MSLESPTLLERIWQHRKLAGIILACLAALGLFLFLVAYQESCSADRRNRKTKEEIANTAKEIANISNTISNLELEKAEKQGELNRDMEQLQRDIFGREEAKAATNAALANFQKAVNTNSNVNRTAEDLERVLREIDQ